MTLQRILRVVLDRFEIFEKRKRSQKWGDLADRYERDELKRIRTGNWTKV